MAENKKSFLLYCDLIHTVSKMPKEKAGELFMHILEYVNDKNPETEDLIIQLTFEPIKQALKRDLQKYENIRLKNIENANKRWNKNNATASDRMQTDTKNAVNGSDSVNDSVIVIDKDNKTINTFPETKVSEGIDFKKLLIYFNSVTNKKCKVINDKTKKQFNARLKEGYTKKDINDAIKNCYNDPYHQENPKYLTLEFISRADKLDKYSNYQKSKSNITTTADDNR